MRAAAAPLPFHRRIEAPPADGIGGRKTVSGDNPPGIDRLVDRLAENDMPQPVFQHDVEGHFDSLTAVDDAAVLIGHRALSNIAQIRNRSAQNETSSRRDDLDAVADATERRPQRGSKRGEIVDAILDQPRPPGRIGCRRRCRRQSVATDRQCAGRRVVLRPGRL
jgi:hypothetical protein